MHLGFLGSWPFRCETARHELWISLDFLGFSRPNRDFSMGYAAFTRKDISRAFSLALRGAGTGAEVEAMRKRRVVHGASLTWFLIFCKRLSALIALAVGKVRFQSRL
jgi:hypothetical protein